MVDFGQAGLAKHYGNDIKAEGSISYIVNCKKVSTCPEEFFFFAGRNSWFRRDESIVGSGSNFDKDDGFIVVNHNQVDFAGFAGEVPCEGFQTFIF